MKNEKLNLFYLFWDCELGLHLPIHNLLHPEQSSRNHGRNLMPQHQMFCLYVLQLLRTIPVLAFLFHGQ
jgi:hypothetical protein